MKESREVARMCANQLSGVWRADYVIYNDDGIIRLAGKHYVRLRPKREGIDDDEFGIESIPQATEARLTGHFLIDGDVALGTWWDVHDGTRLSGGARLVISVNHNEMRGKWVTVNGDMNVVVGIWEFTRLGKDLSAVEKNLEDVGQLF